MVLPKSDASTAHEHVAVARKALNDHHPNDVEISVKLASAHAMVSIAESLATLNRTLKQLADE